MQYRQKEVFVKDVSHGDLQLTYFCNISFVNSYRFHLSSRPRPLDRIEKIPWNFSDSSTTL